VDRALRIHKIIGPGLLESSYEACLEYELTKAGLKTERQKGLPLKYGDVHLDCGYRVDLLVENKVIVEIKAVDALNDIHMAQVITYLKLSGCRLGFLIITQSAKQVDNFISN
jgi:GxxExxY protein